MEELLTAKQVQDALKVDRTTIYRMLKDGRLSGVKIGNHWRFPAREFQDLLIANEEGVVGEAGHHTVLLPVSCLQPLQDVFAEIAEIGSIITDGKGDPLTRMSNSCDFCTLIQSSKIGMKACRRSWSVLASQSKAAPEFTTCHAGLQYARARILVHGKTIAMLIAGQFYADGSHRYYSEEQIRGLAQEYQLDHHLLRLAASRIRVLDPRLIQRISNWLSRMAESFEQVSLERADMLSRLRHIAEMSAID